MPNWNTILDEARTVGGTWDVLRRKYLKSLADLTGRNVITYYSGWLQKEHLRRQGIAGFEVNDSDKNGFMATIHELDRSKGLDLILHTPGGEIAATESLVDYLRSMFGSDVRAIVPQIAMSAGTMIACSCREILMGKHSSIGPIDPQFGGGLPAHGIVEEFKRAKNEVTQNPLMIHLWQPILAKYSPTLIGEAEKAIDWSTQMVKEWLITGMFQGESGAEQKSDRIISELGDHALTKSHARHISLTRARDIGLNVTSLEESDELQDAVLTVHHACIQTFAETNAMKIIENQNGVAYITNLQATLAIQQAPRG